MLYILKNFGILESKGGGPGNLYWAGDGEETQESHDRDVPFEGEDGSAGMTSRTHDRKATFPATTWAQPSLEKV